MMPRADRFYSRLSFERWPPRAVEDCPQFSQNCRGSRAVRFSPKNGALRQVIANKNGPHPGANQAR